MFLFKKKIYLYLYIFFLIIVFIFNEFSTNLAFSKNIIISEVEIEENYDLNFDKSKVIDKSFIKAFNILVYKIIEKKDRFQLKNIPLKQIKSLIDNFSIVDEKFINNKYQSQFEVQFSRKKIIKFMENKNIISSLPREIESFIIPILIDTKNNELYHLNQNIFFKNWNNESQRYFLINYVLPNEDIEDYSIIKKNIDNLESYDFNEIIKKYNLNNYIILIILKKEKQLQFFSKIKLDNKNILMNKIYNDIDIDNEESVNNLILDIKEHYEDRWKSINKLNTSIELPIRLLLDSKDIELSTKLEKVLLNLVFVSDFKIEKFNNEKIIYKIIFNSSPQKFLENMLLFDFKIDSSSGIWKLK
jgi:hypothetical protein